MNIDVAQLQGTSQFSVAVFTFQYSILTLALQAVSTLVLVISSGAPLNIEFAPTSDVIMDISCTDYVPMIENIIDLINEKSFGEIEGAVMKLAFSRPSGCSEAEELLIKGMVELLKAGMETLRLDLDFIVFRLIGMIYFF